MNKSFEPFDIESAPTNDGWVEYKKNLIEGKTEVDGGGLRFNEGKIQWHLIPVRAIEEIVKVMMIGAKKYAPNNWKRGFTFSSVCDCAMRHLTAIMGGELYDKETGLLHAAHLGCNAIFLIYFTITGKYEKFNDLKEWN